MSLSRQKTTRRPGAVLAATLALLVSTLAFAEYVPFPGKLQVRLLDIEAPNIIFVNFETWPGYLRSVRIILPGIVVAEDTPQSDDCEREKAQKAMAFSREFLFDAEKIFVQDMKMETSADEQAVSPIITNKGSLGAALEKAGLARPESVDPDTSWCNPE